MVTKESVLDEFSAVPTNFPIENKYYVGFFDKERLIAVMDLLDGYPEENIAFIGFFMTDSGVHNKGIGTTIISDVIDYLARSHYHSVRLAWAKGNPQAEHFWLKNGFKVIKETSSTAAKHVYLAEKKLSTDAGG